MPVTVDQIIDALRPVQDPELHRSIVDLGMVRDVDAGRRRHASPILVALTVAGCPLKNEIPQPRRRRRRSPSTASPASAVDFTVMTDEEREDAAPAASTATPRATAGSTATPTATPRGGRSRSPSPARAPARC